MWLGEQITERGIGNGISLIIFAGIVVGLPRAIRDIWANLQQRTWSIFTVIVLVVVMVSTVAAVVFVERGQTEDSRPVCEAGRGTEDLRRPSRHTCR